MEHVEKPCAQCGELVLVHPYAATKFVKCAEHKGLTAIKKTKGRTSMLDAFERGLPLEERQRRIVGAVIRLRRSVDVVDWEEEMTATGMRSFDEEAGAVQVFAVVGSSLPNFDARRESGQCRSFLLSEVAGVR